MRHRKRTDKLGRKTPHRAATLSNLVASVLEHERVETTLRLAKSARRYTDKMITLAKRNTLHSRRQAISFLRPSGPDRDDVVRKLFDELGPRYEDRPGGYTRIVKLSPRRGDNAPMAVLELVDAKVVFKERKRKEAEDEVPEVEMEVEGEVQSQEEPVEEASAEEKPVEDAPAEEKPEEKPVEEAPAEEKAEEKPAEEAPAEEKTEEKPAAEAPVEEKAEEKPAEEAPAEEKVAEAAPAEEKPEEKPAEKGKEEEEGGISGFFKKIFHKDDK